MGIGDTTKRFIVKEMINVANNTSKENLIRFLKVAKTFSSAKKTLNRAIELVEEEHPSYKLIKRVFEDASPQAKKKFIENLLLNAGIFGNKTRNMNNEKYDFNVPATILISPTMRCNLKCTGCYAMDYSQKDDLDFDTWNRIITEGKELGTYFFTFLGGEPFVRKEEVFKILEKHDDTYFQIYTNGWLLKEEDVKKMSELGNVSVVLSIEGWEKETDERRGKGSFEQIKRVVDLCRKYKLHVAFSVCITQKNFDVVTSDKFIEQLIEWRGLLVWEFMYMPIGDKPSYDLMLTPVQRNKLRLRNEAIRKKYDIALVDFWNDAPLVGGCIAGRQYIHINSKGDVEPCIFTHFSVDNIHDKSLKEVLSSEFFKDIRKEQPINENLLLPCMLIDNPERFRELYKKYDLKPTHPGAISIVTDPKLMKFLDDYSEKVHKVYEVPWEEIREYYKDNPWYKKNYGNK